MTASQHRLQPNRRRSPRQPTARRGDPDRGGGRRPRPGRRAGRGPAARPPRRPHRCRGRHRRPRTPAATGGTWPRRPSSRPGRCHRYRSGAALPQPLSADSAGPPIRLPSPDSRDGLVPRGFPPTAEGALAQLAALTAAGLVNADPGAYAAAYTAVAAPGAPAVEATPLHRGLVEIRARSGLPRDRRGTRADLQLDPGRRTDQGQHRPRPLRGGLRDRPARQRRPRADPVHRGRGLPGAAVRRRPVVDQPRRGGRARTAGLARQRRGRAGRLPGGDRCCVTPSPTS